MLPTHVGCYETKIIPDYTRRRSCAGGGTQPELSVAAAAQNHHRHSCAAVLGCSSGTEASTCRVGRDHRRDAVQIATEIWPRRRNCNLAGMCSDGGRRTKECF